MKCDYCTAEAPMMLVSSYTGKRACPECYRPPGAPPTTLDELLRVVPGLRRLRSLNADLLRTLLDRQKGECTWCGQPVTGGRRTWCSQECVKAFSSRCSPQDQARLVVERDGPCCQICGRDTDEAQRLAEQEMCSVSEDVSRYSSNFRAIADKIRERHGCIGYTYREIDHIVPVVEGGGLCSIDNLRVLCAVCHRKETRALAKRRKQERKNK